MGEVKYMLVSDIHLNYPALDRLIQDLKVELREHRDLKVIFVGDFIDGVKDYEGSMECMFGKLNRLQDSFPNRVIYLYGNHDYAFVDYITKTGTKNTYLHEWVGIGGYSSMRKMGLNMGQVFEETSKWVLGSKIDYLNSMGLVNLLDFYQNRLQHFYIDKTILAIHAGLDLKDLHDKGWSSESVSEIIRPFLSGDQHTCEHLWYRGEFFNKNYSENVVNLKDKVVVVGHTPVFTINWNDKKSNKVVKIKHEKIGLTKYLIDSGSNSGSSLGCITVLNLDENGKFINYKQYKDTGKVLNKRKLTEVIKG